jgi:hypothetical protein
MSFFSLTTKLQTNMKKHSFLKYFFLFLLAFSNLYCKKSPAETLEKEPTTFRKSFLPLAVGNTWVYVDSLCTNTDTTVRIDTISIIGFRKNKGNVWWKFYHTGRSYGNYYELMEQNDSVYDLQYGEGIGNTSFAAIEYIPPQGDTIILQTTQGGDAGLWKKIYRITQPYFVPSGTFDSCTMFYYHSGQTHQWEVIRPRIGFISFETQNDSLYPGQLFSLRKLKLMNYKLK